MYFLLLFNLLNKLLDLAYRYLMKHNLFANEIVIKNRQNLPIFVNQ